MKFLNIFSKYNFNTQWHMKQTHFMKCTFRLSASLRIFAVFNKIKMVIILFTLYLETTQIL